MSSKMLNLVWERFSGQEGELVVMLLLADLSNDQGSCYHKRTWIARKTRMSERNIRRLIAQLEHHEWIRVVRHNIRGWANEYFLNVEKLEQLAPLPELPEDEDEPPMAETAGQIVLDSDGLRGTLCPPNDDDAVFPTGPRGTPATFSTAKGDTGVPPQNHDMTGHDMIMQPVENSATLQGELGFPKVKSADRPELILPFGMPRRLTISDSDLGSEFSSSELMAAYRQVTHNQIRYSDPKYAELLMEIPFSLRAFMYLMGVVVRKAKVPPASLHYFERALTGLWHRCFDRINAKMHEDPFEKDPAKLFRSYQTAARAEIELWENS